MTRADALRSLKSEHYWLVRNIGSDIELVRTIYGRPTVVLLRNIPGSQKYSLEFPSYIFQSTISHFSPATDEIRLCRNKSLLISLIRMLHRTAIWNFIDNQDFMVINDHNPRSNKNKLRRQLNNLME